MVPQVVHLSHSFNKGSILTIAACVESASLCDHVSVLGHFHFLAYFKDLLVILLISDYKLQLLMVGKSGFWKGR